MSSSRRVLTALVAAVLALSLTACATPQDGGENGQEQTKGPITVGSKIDTEGELLATVIQQALEAEGFSVNDRSQTGSTDVVRKALLAGDIDIYPEYTGSGLLFFQGQEGVEAAVFRDPETGYETSKRLDEANGIVWLEPARANNTWAIVTRRDFAEQNGLKTMSDFAKFVAAGKDVRLAASDEFFNNVDAWPAFVEVYGIELATDQRVVFSGGNTAQTEKAVADGTDGVNFGMAYGTDGALADLGLVVLADDQEAQLVYWPTPVIRAEVLEQYPEIAEILAPIFQRLDLETLQELNARIQVNGERPEDVVADFLEQNGLV